MFSPRVLFCLFFVAAHAQAWQPLFNGKDFTGWESYLAEPLAVSNVPGAEKDASGKYVKQFGLNNDPLRVFTIVIVDGAPAIRVSGEGLGVLSTVKNFSNYHLRFQFKWGTARFGAPNKARNGGLMYHAHGKYGEWGGRWKSALQFQIADGNCGDFIVMGDTTGVINTRAGSPAKAPVYDATPTGKPVLIDVNAPNKGKCARLENFEKPSGEWNTFEVFCAGDKIAHVVNGHVVARAENIRFAKDGKTEPLTGGQIQIQLEMAEMFFREIEIRAIDGMPAEVVFPEAPSPGTPSPGAPSPGAPSSSSAF